VSAAERFLRAVEARYGASVAKMTKTVLSNICGFATRRDAMPRNPVKDTSSISVKPKVRPKALSLQAARQLRTFLTYDDRAIRRDVVDLVDIMLATGVRIGEALALVWDAVDLETATVEIRGTVIRIRGEGLIIKAEPKTEAGFRTLILPSWCVAGLVARCWSLDQNALRPASAAGGFAGGLLFPSLAGTLRDPTNVDDMLKDAFEFAGESMTSHKLRKTAATILDAAKLSARQIADQLGHATPSLTQDVYMGRGELNPAAAEALEALG
jgi:integrase